MIIDFVREKFGDDAASKLVRRRRGGDNNAKGNDHELNFGVYCIARYVTDSNQPSETVTLVAQDLAFVDDLIIHFGLSNSAENYQLKCVQDLRWTSDLVAAFQYQHLLNINFHAYAQSKTILVSGHELAWQRVNGGVPEAIADHTECHYFPEGTINKLLLSYSPFREAITQVCVHPDQKDKLENAATALLGAWTKSRSGGYSVKQVYEDALRVSPSHLKSFGSVSTNHFERIKKVIDNYKAINYSLEGNRLVYSADSLGIDGMIFDPIDSPAFLQLVESLEMEPPSSEWELIARLGQ